MDVEAHTNDLVACRFVGGLGIGMLSMVVPLYISEISPPDIRGALLVLEEFSIVTGIVSDSLVHRRIVTDITVGHCMGYIVHDTNHPIGMGMEAAIVAPDHPWTHIRIWYQFPAVQSSMACIQRPR